MYTFYCDPQMHYNITQLKKTNQDLLERIVFDEENQVKFCLKINEDPITKLAVLNHTYKKFVVSTEHSCIYFKWHHLTSICILFKGPQLTSLNCAKNQKLINSKKSFCIFEFVPITNWHSLICLNLLTKMSFFYFFVSDAVNIFTVCNIFSRNIQNLRTFI